MRVFVAIEIKNNDIINSIKEFQEKVNIDAKAVELQNLHFTLQFLGEISDEIAQKIIQSLKTIEFSSFNVSLKGIGAFPKPKFPRVVWIGTDEIGGNMLIQGNTYSFGTGFTSIFANISKIFLSLLLNLNSISLRYR